MPTVKVIQDNKSVTLKAENGETLASVLSGGKVHLDMPCAAKGICMRCTVKASGELSAPDDAERRAFTAAELQDGMRLACRARVCGDAAMELVAADAAMSVLAGNNEGVQAKNPMYGNWGLAVDIGTTTLCAAMLGGNGTSIYTTRKNPQAAFGADVISRIEKALSGEAARLAESVRAALSEMIRELAAAKNISPVEIDAAVITGNTTMLYLLTGQNPEALSHAPFEADRLFGEFVSPDLLGLGISEASEIYLPSCISAFVGADITTAILASGMCGGDKVSLLADIGTNGELALWRGGRLYCTSTAAGPAFEGGGISNGVYGIKGAIDKAWTEGGKICSSTIAGAAAVGICGSGVVDALAAMLSLGVIDETGAFENGDSLTLRDGVNITAQDVRKIQLAKGSVRAGIETLIETSGLEKSQISVLYIAGGFGNYLNLGNAAAIGLIPPELLPVTKSIGNAAHTGAIMLLQDKSLIEKSSGLARHSQTVALDANPVFTENYMNYMMFE